MTAIVMTAIVILDDALDQASTASLASMTYTISFHQKMTDTDGCIIPGTKMTNTLPFLWNGY